MIRLNFKEFLKDSSGGTAVAMGVCLVTLAIVLGAGLDTTRLVSAKQKTVDALDAATLYAVNQSADCLLYTSPSPRDKRQSRMPSSA